MPGKAKKRKKRKMNTDNYTISFSYEELDAVYAALACYEFAIKKERENGRTDHPERAAQVSAPPARKYQRGAIQGVPT